MYSKVDESCHFKQDAYDAYRFPLPDKHKDGGPR
jgi:hypothetical protein